MIDITKETNLVLDSTVVAATFIPEQYSSRATNLIKYSLQNDIQLHSLQLLLSEVVNVLIKNNKNIETVKDNIKHLSQLSKYRNFHIHNLDEKLLLQTIDIAEHPLAPQSHISSYDASFHALAMILNCPLVTLDKKHYNKTKDIIGNIVLVSDIELPD